MSQACPGNTPLSQLLQHSPKHPRARHPHPWQGTLPEGSRHAGCSAWRDLRAFSSLPRQAQLGQTQHLAREKLPANFSLRLSTQAAAAAQPLCKAGQRRGEGCGTTAHCWLKTPEWRAGAATLTGAGANPSPWLSDGARTKLQLPEGSAPGPKQRSQDSRSAQRNKRGCKPAGLHQEDLRSFTHFWTVLELVHLGLQHAMLSKHRFANASHRRACSGSFPSWSLLQRAACCRTVTQGWDACPAAPATCSPCCGSGCLG